ncbi:MAG: Ycf66 family protein [Cyanophyceae cyanobacterium]
MVNFGLNSASLLGIFLAVAGAALYFLRSVRPELSRDHDIFFAAVGLLCGFILLFQGWRLDPILQFGQFLLTGAAVFFAVETIRLRGVATEQARRNTPIVDEERPVGDRVRVYRAELDQLEPYDTEEEYDNRRLRGYPESRSSRRTAYDSEAPRPKPRGSAERYPTRTGSKSSRRPRSKMPPASEQTAWGEAEWGDRNRASRSRPAERSTSRRRRPRPTDSQLARTDTEATAADYVDYQPISDAEARPSRNQTEGPGKGRDERGSSLNFDY